MKPRLFFILSTALVVVIMALILVVSIGLASFISFGLRLNGHESLLGFGTRGPLLFLAVFPWGLALIDLALIAVLAWLLRRFKFGYRKPLLILVAVLVVGAAAIGLGIDRESRFHDDRYEEAEAGELLGPLETLYESARMSAPEEYGIYRGFVISKEDDSFMLTHDDHDNDEDDGTWKVYSPPGFVMELLQLGDRVYVAGEREEDGIEAYGVRILER